MVGPAWPLEQMKREVNDIGYDLVIESGRSAEEIHRQEFTLLRRRTLLSWVLAILVMCLSMGWISVGSVLAGNVLSLLLALVCMLLCGRNIYVSAWRQLFHRTANMDTLVALSTLIAFLLSTFNTFFGDAVWGSRGIGWNTFFDASVMIITFVLTGRLLEEKAKDGAASSIRRLMGMQPKTAHIVNGDSVEEVPLSTIEKGDLLEVRAGEKIPVDGVVQAAQHALIDESAMTGEAALVDRPLFEFFSQDLRQKSGILHGTPAHVQIFHR